MTDLAITSMGLAGKVEVLPIEVNRDGNSFTLVLGTDAAKNLPNWHKSEELLNQVKVMVITRPGTQPSGYEEINIKALDISSTKVRLSISNRENVSNLLPAKVVTFIREFGLYGSR